MGVQPLGALVWEVAKEGAQLMVVDVSVQASLSVTIFLTATRNFETAFKLAAVDSAYWLFGPSYLVGIVMVFRLMGSSLISAGRHKAFISFTRFMLLLGLVLTLAAVADALMHRIPSGYYYGETACVYATDPACVSAYTRIFEISANSSSTPMSTVFEAFGPTVGLNMLFGLLRGVLAACHDFSFMAKVHWHAVRVCVCCAG